MLDVGANTGCFSLLAEDFPDLKVLSFEPSQPNFQAPVPNPKPHTLNPKP